MNYGKIIECMLFKNVLNLHLAVCICLIRPIVEIIERQEENEDG